MGLFGSSKKEIALQNEIEALKAQLNPDQQKVAEIKAELENLEEQKRQYEKYINDLIQKVQSLNNHVEVLNREISERSAQIVNLKEYIEVQDYGLYKPSYVFANSDLYKDRLKNVRELQKNLIKNNGACFGNMGWRVNGNAAQGQKMVRDMQKLLLRAFNVECDDIVANVKVSNFEKSKERIRKISGQVSNLGKIMSISIKPEYLNLKIEELRLALDFAQKKEEEKERLKELKEQQREEAKAQKEIEEARKKLKKEQQHYQNALSALNEQLKSCPDNLDLITKKNELLLNISDIEKAISDVDYREANKRAGYVYIISNIGAFGENVYKIGMTRRLDPMERVDELGDASVPFNFDVHALIFTEDAPKLEAALHSAFEQQKINKVNSRREFFKVSLDEIKKVVRENYDKTVEWIDIPEAEQYRQSLIISR